MGRCAACDKRIGVFFGKAFRRIEGSHYCAACVPEAIARRKESTIQKLDSLGTLTILVTVPVITRDLDSPSNHRRYCGDLLFTDKGLIFAQYTEWKKEDATPFAGLLVRAIVAYTNSSRKKRALRQTQQLSLDQMNDIDRKFENAAQLFFFPIEAISKLKAGNSDCCVNADHRVTWFRWQNGKKSILPVKNLLVAYVNAINTRQDVLSACAGFFDEPAKRPELSG